MGKLPGIRAATTSQKDREPSPILFPTTRWSQIRPGATAGDETATRALEALARGYFRPILAYLRAALRRPEEEARDLAQDFFLWMIESDFLGKADPSRGRFRAFVKVALRHYVLDRDRRAHARKRGGERRFVPLDDGEDGAPAFDLPDPSERSPEESLDLAWRADLLAQALARLEEELRRQGCEVVFAVFRDYFLDPGPDLDYRAVAERHGLSTADVSNHLVRAKRRFQAHLRALVLETVRSAPDLEEELCWLFGKEPR